MNTPKSIEATPDVNSSSLIKYFAWTVVTAFFIAAFFVGGCFILLDLILH